MEPVSSPCVKVCQYDAGRGLCLGCYRSLDEITRWSTMTDAARRETLVECQRRELGQEPHRRV